MKEEMNKGQRVNITSYECSSVTSTYNISGALEIMLVKMNVRL